MILVAGKQRIVSREGVDEEVEEGTFLKGAVAQERQGEEAGTLHGRKHSHPPLQPLRAVGNT